MILNRALLIPFFTEQCGGPYDVILETSKHLKQMGVHSKLYTTSYIEKKGKRRTTLLQHYDNYLTIFRYDSFLKFREYRVSSKLFSALLKDKKKIDIVHSNAIRSFQEDIGAIFSFLKKKPFVITPHGAIGINWDYGDKIPKMIYDKSVGYLKQKLLNPHFVAVAKNEIQIIKNYGVDEDHIHYIPHGINTEFYKPLNFDELKKNLNLQNNDVLLYVGRIAKGKGVDKLIRMMNMIVKKNKEVKLIIVGSDFGYLSTINSLIKKYNLSDYILITGHIGKKELPYYYSMADLVVYPSRQEIFGLVLLEASACGKPVIGSNIMGPKEIIIDGETGYTSDFEDLKKISDKILNLLNDKHFLSEMGKKGRKRAVEKFSWKKAAHSHLKLYKKILNI